MRQLNRISILVFIFGLLFITDILEASNWVLVVSAPNGTQMFVDKESIKHVSKNIVRALRKYQFKEPREDEAKDYTALSVYGEVNCEEERFLVLSEILHFDDNTQEVKNYKPSDNWEDIKPNTFDDYFYEYVCKAAR
jgi:hypothetical protein